VDSKLEVQTTDLKEVSGLLAVHFKGAFIQVQTPQSLVLVGLYQAAFKLPAKIRKERRLGKCETLRKVTISIAVCLQVHGTIELQLDGYS